MWGDPRRVLSAHSRPRLVAATRSVTTRNVTHPTIFFDFQSTRPPQGGLCVFALGRGRGLRADAWWAWGAAGRAAVDRRQVAGRGRAAFVASTMRSRCGPAKCQNATPVGASTPAWRAGAPNAASARCLFMVLGLFRPARPGRRRFGLGLGQGLRVWSSDLRTSATRSRPGAAWFTERWPDAQSITHSGPTVSRQNRRRWAYLRSISCVVYRGLIPSLLPFVGKSLTGPHLRRKLVCAREEESHSAPSDMVTRFACGHRARR